MTNDQGPATRSLRHSRLEIRHSLVIGGSLVGHWSLHRNPNNHVVARMGPDRDGETTELIESGEEESGEGAEQEIVTVHRFAMRSDVMGRGKQERGNDGGRKDRHRALDPDRA